ncbi:MAG: phospholipase D-like domain-containing protein [Planctomycetota bacterium]
MPRSVPPPPPPVRPDPRAARVGIEHVDAPDLQVAEDSNLRLGLNLEPGSQDDGWEHPDAVELRDGSGLRLYKDGEALAAAFAGIKDARHTVYLETYILANDDTGKAFVDLLSDKARAGVEVYLIYDSFGSFLSPRKWFEQLRKAGGHVAEFHPMRPWETKHSWRPGWRDHRKMLVIDGRIGGIGGINIGTRYAGGWVAKLAQFNPKMLWRDNAIAVTGPAVGQLAESFRRTWHYTQRAGPIRRTMLASNLRLPDPAKGLRLGKQRSYDVPKLPGRFPEDLLKPDADFGLLATGPTLSSPLRPILQAIANHATRRIWLTSAYFAPDEEFIVALCNASKRGIDVRLMLAGRSDANILITAARSFYDRLLDAGVRIFERQGAMLHTKAMTIDGRLALIGSTNLDYRSIEFNLEASAVVRSPQFAEQMETLFEHDMRFSREIDADEWRERPWRDRIVQWIVNRVRYVL